MKNRWIILAGLVATWTAATTALAQPMPPAYYGAGPVPGYGAPPPGMGYPGAPTPGYGAMVPGYPPPMAGPGMPMGPYGMGGMPVNAVPPGMVPVSGPMSGMPYQGPGQPPLPGPQQPPPVAPVPGALGQPIGFIEAPCCQQPPTCPRLPPAMRGSYTAFTEQQPIYSDANCEYERYCGGYIEVGALGLQRQHLESGQLAFLDSTGQTVLAFTDVNPAMHAAIQAMAGYDMGCGAIELSGWYLFQGQPSGANVMATGDLGTPFYNVPPGFTGLLGPADQMNLSFSTSMWNAEAVFRYYCNLWTSLRFIIGARYFGDKEDLDLRSVGTVTVPQDPTLIADYAVHARNNVVGPEIGFELDHPFLDWFALDLQFKYVPGVNILQVSRTLERGDGLVGLDEEFDRAQFSQLFEIGAYVDMYFSTSVKARLGYMLFWAVDVVEATRQVEFDLQPTGKWDGHGSAFYSGPVAELSIKF